MTRMKSADGSADLHSEFDCCTFMAMINSLSSQNFLVGVISTNRKGRYGELLLSQSFLYVLNIYCGSKLNHQGTAGSSPWFQGNPFWDLLFTHSHPSDSSPPQPSPRRLGPSGAFAASGCEPWPRAAPGGRAPAAAAAAPSMHAVPIARKPGASYVAPYAQPEGTLENPPSLKSVPDLSLDKTGWSKTTVCSEIQGGFLLVILDASPGYGYKTTCFSFGVGTLFVGGHFGGVVPPKKII